MFDLGAMELLVIVIVAIVVIGPKEMPRAMRTAGRWIGKVRKVSSHFRTGIDAMVREAELEDMEKKWKARNEEIMRNHPTPEQPAAGAEAAVDTMTGPPAIETPTPDTAASSQSSSSSSDPADKA
jgi:sec-independent protein translocase protein TatB